MTGELWQIPLPVIQLRPASAPSTATLETEGELPPLAPTSPATLARAVRALCDALLIFPADVPVLLAAWWQAWETHPAFRSYYTPGRDGFVPPRSLLKPVVMGAWRHAPGRGGHDRSYLIGAPGDVLAGLDWGDRTYGGTFIGLLPIIPDAPVHPSRTTMWAFSYKGAGGAYEARLRLKQLLPRVVHPWISKARSANAHPKRLLVPASDPSKPGKLPDAYRRRTKGEIWVEEHLPEQIRRTVAAYMDPDDFWRCATGRVHPDKVEGLVRKHVHHFWMKGERA